MIGIGIDAVEIERFRGIISQRPGFLGRVFTDRERNDLKRRIDQIPGLAARFAAKEATMKALGVGIGAVAFHDIEVCLAPSGAPSLVLSGRALIRSHALGVDKVLVSLTHTSSQATAIVFADGPRQEQRP